MAKKMRQEKKGTGDNTRGGDALKQDEADRAEIWPDTK